MKKAKKKRTGLKITLIVVGVIFVIIAAYGHIPSPFVSGVINKNDYSHVMRDLNTENPNVGNASINKIAMLGAHDCLSYGINYTSSPNVNEDNVVNNPMLRILGKGVMVRFSRAQYHNIYTQLKKGVRYIDARITYINGRFYTSHGLVSCLLDDSVKDILRFLDENPGEFIIFHILHYFPGKGSIDDLRNHIADIKYNGNSLYDYVNYNVNTETDFQSITYNDVTSSGAKAGAILLDQWYSDKGGTQYKDYYKLTKYIDRSGASYFDYTMQPSKVKKHFNDLPALSNKLVVNESQITPNDKEVWRFLTNTSLLHTAVKSNTLLLNDPDFDNWFTKMPIYMCDYATQNENNFNDTINEKIHQFNLKINV